MQSQRYLSIPLLLAFVVGLDAQTVRYTIKVRDLRTKLAVQAEVQFEGPESVSMETDKTGKLRLALPPGKYEEAIAAPGYKTIKVSITIRPEGMPESIVMLEPIKKAENQTYRGLEAQLRPGYTLVEGKAVDEDGQPVADVSVRLEGESIAPTETTTNSSGIYSFLVPTPPETAGPVDTIPGTGNVIAKKSGYKTLVHYDVPLVDNDYQSVLLHMERGSGILKFDDMPVPLRGDDAIHDDEGDNAKPEKEPASGAPTPKPEAMIGTFPLPGMITVGTTCPKLDCQSNNPDGKCYFTDCTKHTDGCPLCGKKYGQCTGPVLTLPLEDYVEEGLEREWFKRWYPPSDALEAGAVAYRTYGAFFIEHPGRSGSSNYDIRNDTCDQRFVEDDNPPQYVEGAAIKTMGIATSDDGVNAYDSEYASDTNNAPPTQKPLTSGCEDGYTGDGADWPCMKDPISAGTKNFGHGRGMSQFGSWWWASGYNSRTGARTTPSGWQCILDHYYNDNGNSTGNGGQNTARYSFIYGPGGDGFIAYTPLVDIPSAPTRKETLAQRRLAQRRLAQRHIPATQAGCGSDLYTLDLDGTDLFDITPNQCNGSPSWSPSQTQIAYDLLPTYFGNLEIVSSDGSVYAPLGPWGYDPDWSRENMIVYSDFTQQGLVSIPPTGGTGFLVVADPGASNPFWSPSGTQVAYETCYPSGSSCNTVQIAVADAVNGGFLQFLTTGPGDNFSPAWSPDGTQIVYLSDQSGTPEVWTMNFDGTLQQPLTFNSTNGNFTPRWSQDGHYIVWLSSGLSGYTLSSMNPNGTNASEYGSPLPSTAGTGPAMKTTRCRPMDSL